jgi:phosphatidylglycerophosphatase A
MKHPANTAVPVLTWGALLRQPLHWLPFGLGSGLLPRAPGTWGSLLACVLGWFLYPLPAMTTTVMLSAAFLFGIWNCGASARRLGLHDHPGIVLDEIVAMLAVLAVTPRELPWFVGAFLLFRLFDIWKPWPIREADHRLRGGLGIMLDDGLAAVYAVLAISGIGLLPFH